MMITAEELKAGAKRLMCADHISRCDELYRQQIYTILEHERLRRKYGDIERLFKSDGVSNWNQTFYLLFMRTLGDKLNQNVFMEVARRLSLTTLMRERASVSRVEAMLVGASGFLDCYPNYNYIESIRDEAMYMMRKHSITPLTPTHWNLSRVRPINHPVVRLSQVASLVCEHEFIFNDTLLCKNKRDVDTLFGVKVTELFADTHPHLTCEGKSGVKIGADKRNLLGINLVVPMVYAYGQYIHDEELCLQAQELNESLFPEMNIFIKRWCERGVYPASSFESQALLQLTTCYCKTGRCEECPAGRMIVSGVI